MKQKAIAIEQYAKDKFYSTYGIEFCRKQLSIFKTYADAHGDQDVRSAIDYVCRNYKCWFFAWRKAISIVCTRKEDRKYVLVDRKRVFNRGQK